MIRGELRSQSLETKVSHLSLLTYITINKIVELLRCGNRSLTTKIDSFFETLNLLFRIQIQ
jgi:hypothetical protein